MLRKAIQELAHAYHLAFLSQANRTYSNLTRHLEAVIIEVSSVQVLRLRANQQQVHNAKSPSQLESMLLQFQLLRYFGLHTVY